MPTQKLRIAAEQRRLPQALRIALLAALAVLLFIAYQAGQMNAGHNRFEAAAERQELQDLLDDLEVENQLLREEAARLRTASEIDEASYAQVEQELVDLQNTIADQAQRLAFLEGIVSDSSAQKGLRIQDFRISEEDSGGFRLYLVLAKDLRNDDEIRGKVKIVVSGTQAEETAELGLDTLWPEGEGAASVDYRFRYFQNLDVLLSLPEGFEPASVSVSVSQRGKKSETVQQSYDWALTSR